jgi:beta-xylosidase
MIYTGHCYTNCTSEPGVRLLAATSTDGITWTKVTEPVLSRSTEIEWMKDGAAEADLIQGPDGAFYMFFTGMQDEQRVIGVARGASPFGPWEINPDPIVRPTPGSFDEAGVLAPEVIIEQGKARMWYLAFAAGEFPFIGYAESVWPLFVPAP